MTANIPPNVHLVYHPVVETKLTALRSVDASSKSFREGIRDISLFLGIEASRDLPLEALAVQTPIAPATGSVIASRLCITPIMRAGMGMTDALLTLFPDASVFHIGLFRDKTTLQPVEYYSKLPENADVDLVYLVDPLIATGGTANAAVTMIKEWGVPVERIRFLAILASVEGLHNLQTEFPDLHIWVAAIDLELTPQGWISPGLGDTGDRLFNTLL